MHADDLVLELHRLDGHVCLEILYLGAEHLSVKFEAITGLSLLAEPVFSFVSIEEGDVLVLDVGLDHRLVLVEGILDHLAGLEAPELGLIDGLAHLHTEDVRGEDLVGLIVVDNDLLGRDVAV